NREGGCGLVTGVVRVHGPTGRGKDQVACLPVEALTVDLAVTTTAQVVVHRHGAVTVRDVVVVGGRRRNRREEAVGGADAALGGRVVQYEQTAAVVAPGNIFHRRQVFLDNFPGPVQRLGLDDINVDQPFVAQQVCAFFGDLLAQCQVAGAHGTVGAGDGGGLLAFIGRRRVAFEFFNVMHFQLLEQGCVGIGEANPGFLAVVVVAVDRQGGRVPDVELGTARLLAVANGHAAARDTDLDHVRVLAHVQATLTRVQNVDGDVDPRGQAQAGLGGFGVNDQARTAAVVGPANVLQAADFFVNGFLWNHDGRPHVLFTRFGAADIHESICFAAHGCSSGRAGIFDQFSKRFSRVWAGRVMPRPSSAARA